MKYFTIFKLINKPIYIRNKDTRKRSNIWENKNLSMQDKKKWPTYYSRAKGAYVWHLENKRYLDMYFGVGQSIKYDIEIY